jgi:hypothetical protein
VSEKPPTSPFRAAGPADQVQAELEAAARRIGAPSLERVEDVLLAAMAATPESRRFFIHRAVRDLYELAVRDAQRGMEGAGR